MKHPRAIKAVDEQVSNPTILGVYEGECADADITNENGLDITRDVWKNTFESEDYQKGIEHGWFIGFLGHPDDPGCQDFQQGCIVMTEGHIDESGKVYGKFNLIDTPVGRIVKTYIDAGVEFGISVRGAGDIINNSVDPDTFVFRGFDLVAFPAFPESIPTFSALAASSDIDQKRKYQAVCAAIDANIKNIKDKQTLEILQQPLAKQSDAYKEIESQIAELREESKDDKDTLQDIDDLKLTAVTNLYADCLEQCKELERMNAELTNEVAAIKSSSEKRLRKLQRIVSNQEKLLNTKLADLTVENERLIKANKSLSKQHDILKGKNLKYTQMITASKQTIAEKDNTIAELKAKLSKTVRKVEASAAVASDLDEKIKSNDAKLVKAQQQLAEYQQAYADLYAAAIGRDSAGITITATTSVSELKDQICCSSNSTESIDSPIPIDLENVDDSGLVIL